MDRHHLVQVSLLAAAAWAAAGKAWCVLRTVSQGESAMKALVWIRVSLLAAAFAAGGVVVVGGAAAEEAASTDWPQWLGPNRDGVSREPFAAPDWSAGGPKVLWKASVGTGYSSVAVVKGRVYTMGNDGSKDTVWCLGAADGEVIWQHRYDCPKGSQPGTRATPTVDGGLVYTLSREGHLYCLDAADGTVKWSRNVMADDGVQQAKYRWGLACSPLVLGEKLILDVGKVLGLDKATGKVVWECGSDTAGFSSPVAFRQGGKTYVTSFNAAALVIVDAEAGKEVARYPWKTDWLANAAAPIVSGERIFISSGYKRGCALLRFDGASLTSVYEVRSMNNHCNNCVLWQGYLYGVDGNMGKTNLACIDLETGKARWSDSGASATALTLADGKLMVIGSRGSLTIAEASPEGFKKLAEARLPGGKWWTIPVLSGGRIYCRSHQGTLLCLDAGAGK